MARRGTWDDVLSRTFTRNLCRLGFQSQILCFHLVLLWENAEDCRVDVWCQQVSLVELHDMLKSERVLQIADLIVKTIPLDSGWLLEWKCLHVVKEVLWLFVHITETFLLAREKAYLVVVKDLLCKYLHWEVSDELKDALLQSHWTILATLNAEAQS